MGRKLPGIDLLAAKLSWGNITLNPGANARFFRKVGANMLKIGPEFGSLEGAREPILEVLGAPLGRNGPKSSQRRPKRPPKQPSNHVQVKIRETIKNDDLLDENQ